MNRSIKSTMLAGMFAGLLIGSANLVKAQDQPQNQQPRNRPGRGGDPAQFRERMMERFREVLEVKGDDEWKILEARINKVMEARREVGFGGFGGFGGRRGGPGGPGGDAPGRGGFGPPNPEAEALQNALEGKASNDEIKTKLAALRESRKTKEAAVEKAQAELQKVLSVKQEAAAVLAGLLR